MTVFTCEETFEAMMTCIYDAWASRLGHANVRLELEPVWQQELFCEYRHVEANGQKAEKVVRSIQKKISFAAYQQVYLAAMSFEKKRLDAIYRFLIPGFVYGKDITEMLAIPAVMQVMELSRKVGREANYFREFTRFTLVENRFYVAHIEPKCNITSIAAEHFADRMPSEYWMMIDDNRQIAAIHPKDEPFYMTHLSDKEFMHLLETEDRQDMYTDLWKEFFNSIGIEARKSHTGQRNMIPLWYRKHTTEFM